METEPSPQTKAFNLFVSGAFSLVAVALLLPAGVNLYGALSGAVGDRVMYWAWAIGCLVVAADVLWLGWRVVPRAFAPRSVADLRRTFWLLLLGIAIFVLGFALPAVLNASRHS